MDELEVFLATSGLIIFFCGVPLFCICYQSRNYELIQENEPT